jgi:outer membrane protein assembly factor BamA
MKTLVFKAKFLTGLFLSALIYLPVKAVANDQSTPAAAPAANNGSTPLIIDSIICEGNKTTQCDFITKKYYQQPGDVLDADEIADAKLRLGTLIQFKTINTRLAKGRIRGHVVVIFAVNEASHIQYDQGLAYQRMDTNMGNDFCLKQYASTFCSRAEGQSSTPRFNAAITDFNVFGTGKRLSLHVSKYVSQTTGSQSATIDRTDPAEEDYQFTDSARWHSNSTSLFLEYYDPHFFDSTHYFFRTQLNHQGSLGRGNLGYRNFLSDDYTLNLQSPQIAGSSNVQLELGRRFGSHSYLSFDLGGSFHTSQSDVLVGVNYGWDSQDDNLFATQGSAFKSSLHLGDGYGEQSFDFNYKKHHALADNQVLTFGAFGLANKHSSRAFREVSGVNYSAGVSARFTSINPINQLEGAYSGWFTELNLSGTNGTYNSPKGVNFGVQAGYTYQTDTMVYRFSLGYNNLERN